MKREAWWLDEPWRLVQTNLREIDMEDLSAELYVQELQKLRANAAMISIGGLLANYDTKICDHPVNPHLHGDSLDKVIGACKDAGIRVIGRVDFSKVKREIYERHPDWAYRTAGQEIVDYNGFVHACICGDYQQKKALEILKEIVLRFPIDGLFINMGGFNTSDYSFRYHGICHCESCRRGFRESFGLELPDKEDLEDPIYRKYIRFQNKVKAEYKNTVTGLVHSIRPDVAVEGSDFIRLESNTELGRPQWVYDSSSTVRGVQNLNPWLPCSNPTVDFIAYSYRHVAVSPWQQSLRLYQTIANLGYPDYYLMGRLEQHEDRSGYDAVKKAFAFHADHWKDLRGLRQIGDALLIRKGGYDKSLEGCGWVRALSESHILFHEAEPVMIGTDTALLDYCAVIVTDVQSLSDGAIQALDKYVSQGGTLVLSGDPCRYRESGREKTEIPFSGLRECSLIKRWENARSSMLKLSEKEADLLPALRGTSLVAVGEEYYEYTYPSQAEAFLRFVPPHPYGPPELCSYSVISESPGLVKIPFGRGQILHIPWNAGRLYMTEGYLNTLGFMTSVLRQFAGLGSVEHKAFSPMAEVTMASATDRGILTVFLVNTSGFFGNSFFPPLEIKDLEIRCETEEKAESARSLVTGRSIPYEQHENHIVLFVPSLKEFEAIQIKMEGTGGSDEKHSKSTHDSGV